MSLVAQFLLMTAVVVVSSNLLGALATRLRQPAVVGEILGGLLLGPSGLGLVWPAAFHRLFPPDVVSSLQLVAQLGLITFMFLLGHELRGHTEPVGYRRVLVVTLGAMGLPLVAGALLAVPGRAVLAGPHAPRLMYVAFFGLAVAVTALPVLARVLVDLGMAESPVGRLAVACAALGDGTMWAAFSVMLGILGSHGALDAGRMVLLAVFLGGFTVLVARRALAALARRVERHPHEERLLLAVLVGGALAYAAATQSVGLHAAIGAFAFGLAVPHGFAAVARVRDQLFGFVLAVLLPLFFAGLGLTVSVRTLAASPGGWVVFGTVLVTAVLTKCAGSWAGARLSGLPRSDALRLGVLMNCRGVTELIVAAIGLQYGLISAAGFAMLVLMALVTTAATGPLLRLLARREAPPHAGLPAVLSKKPYWTYRNYG